MEEDAAPNCAVRLMPLEAVGLAEDGRDARWVYPVADCSWVQIA